MNVKQVIKTDDEQNEKILLDDVIAYSYAVILYPDLTSKALIFQHGKEIKMLHSSTGLSLKEAKTPSLKNVIAKFLESHDYAFVFNSLSDALKYYADRLKD